MKKMTMEQVGRVLKNTLPIVGVDHLYSRGDYILMLEIYDYEGYVTPRRFKELKKGRLEIEGAVSTKEYSHIVLRKNGMGFSINIKDHKELIEEMIIEGKFGLFSDLMNINGTKSAFKKLPILTFTKKDKSKIKSILELYSSIEE